MSEERTYWEGRLSDAYSLDGVGWQGLGEPFNRWMYRVRRRLFLSRLRPLVEGRAPDVLDVGSGTGFYVERWLELGAGSVTGSDLTETAVGRLGERFPALDFHRLDLSEPGARVDGRDFDAISAMDVLFHITDDAKYERAIANLAAMLRPGGLLVLTENFVHGEPLRSERQVSRTLATIEGLVRAQGLEVVERRPVFFLMNGPADSDSRVLRSTWGLTTRALTRRPALGGVVGPLLYPVELALASTVREGPSTEMMVLRRSRR
ncbi:MAG: class I SAM-dependent methyltransferase [Thermoleophilaceae bacterium]|nr:class I SAM-dependent methyltransferase [Thermoleophilaceae bacterium]